MNIREWKNKYRIEIIVFIIALTLRVILFSFNFSNNDFNLIKTIQSKDGYYEISQGILNGNGFSADTVSPYRANPLRLPLWPFIIAFLAGTFGSYYAVAVFQIIIGSFIPILGIYVARRVVPNRYSIIAGFILACEPYSILLSFILLTETIFTFLFLIFLIFLFRYIEKETLSNVIWSGVFLGLATLVKPTIQFFPIIIPLTMLYILRKRLTINLFKHLFIFLAVFFFLIAPWLYRNYKEFGVWGMSAQPVLNLYMYLAPTVLSIDNRTSFNMELDNFIRKDGFDFTDINLSNEKFYKDKAVKVIMNHKIALIKSAAITFITFFTHDGMLTVLQYSDISFEKIFFKPALSLVAHPTELVKVVSYYIYSPAIIIILARLFWIVAMLLFLFGVFIYLKKEGFKKQAIVALVIVLYFVLTTAVNGFGVNARFRIPVNIFILSFAVYGFYAVGYIILDKLNGKTKVLF